MVDQVTTESQAKLEQELFAKERFVSVSMVIHRPSWAPDPEKEAEEKLKEARRQKKNKKLRARGKEEIEKEPPAAPKVKIDVDIANILRGGYPKAKFNAEPAETGDIALTKTCDGEQDFSVVHLKIPEAFVRSINDETEWTVMSGKHGAREKMLQMAKLLRKKDQELEELEELLNSATESIQAFHLQQKKLFEEFVLLRSNYDDCKLKLRESVWVHSCKMSREFSVIPPLLRNAVEDTNTIEQYLLGGVIGAGESSKVRACKLGMSGGSSRKGGSSSGMAKLDLAVKIINKSRVRDVVALQRVANEIRVLREANNLNVMRLFDVIHTDYKLYLVLERGDRDLFQLIMEADIEQKKKNNWTSNGKGSNSKNDGSSGSIGRVDESLTQEVLKQLLSGVRYLHGMNVCHRDLKPENVVLVEKPGAAKPIVKIIDFGSCAATHGGLTLHDLCGTPGFIPPEMIMEDAYDGFTGDVWSIGCIALEMTIGHANFIEHWLPVYNSDLVGNRTNFALQMAQTVPNLRNVMRNLVKNKQCSAASQDIIFQSLLVNPKKRISCDDFFIHRWVGGKSSEINMESNGVGDDDTNNNNVVLVNAQKMEGEFNNSNNGGKKQETKKLGVSLIDASQEKLMRRSHSVNDLKSVNLSKELSKPPTPRRLPPIDHGMVESNGSSKVNGGNDYNDESSTKMPKQKLSVDATMANKYKNVNSIVSKDGIIHFQEPSSPAISSATEIMNKGNDILAQFKKTEGGTGFVKSGISKNPESLRPLGFK